MVAGQGTPDQAPARMLAYRHPERVRSRSSTCWWRTRSSICVGQLKAGADRAADLRHLGRRAAAARVRALVGRAGPAHRCRRAQAGAGTRRSSAFRAAPAASCRPMSSRLASTPSSIDWATEPSMIRERVQNRVAAVQGNLDPLALIAGGAALDSRGRRRAGELRQGAADLQPRPRHPAGNPDRPCRADAARRGCGRIEMRNVVMPGWRAQPGDGHVQRRDGVRDHAALIRGYRLRPYRILQIMSDAFSAIMIVGALVLPDIRSGMIGRIDHPQAIDAAHLKPLVDDRERIVAHPAGRGRVIDRAAGAAAEVEQIRRRSDRLRPGIDLLGANRPSARARPGSCAGCGCRR